MSVLVIAEHDNQRLQVSTRHTLGAAIKLSEKISVLVAGHQCDSVVSELQTLDCVTEILVADDLRYANVIAEHLVPLIVSLANRFAYLLAPANTFGKNVMPRVSAKCDVGQVSDVIDIVNQNTYKRPMYAGNVIATVKSQDALQILTIRMTAFEAVHSTGGQAKVTSVEPVAADTSVTFVNRQVHGGGRPALSAADIVISGGRGLRDKQGFAKLIAIADRLGAAVGASRAAVDGGLAPNDFQVGQTGQVVAPKLYIAVGISGAIQHLAGMKDSKVIVAINKDSQAPIFQVADYGLVADIFDILPEWERILTEMGY